MPLVHVECVASEIGCEVHSGVAVHTMRTFRKRGGIVLAIELEETTKMSHGNVDGISESIEH